MGSMPMPPLCPFGMAAVMQPCCKASVLAALVSLRSERTKRPLEQLVVCTGERGPRSQNPAVSGFFGFSEL